MATDDIKIHKGGDFHWVGNGFPVRSIFSYNDLGQELSPFLLLDYAPPYHFPPGNEKRGVGAHPHRGFETVTIVYQGELQHRDSSGGGGVIGPGDVQWMTAAGGLVHEEFHTPNFVSSGGTFQVAQLWVNLPKKDKGADPGYQTLPNASIPTRTLSDGSSIVRVIAGELHGTRGPARTFTPINLWDVKIEGGTNIELPIPPAHSRLILNLNGETEINNRKITDGELAIIKGDIPQVSVHSKNGSQLLIMTGEPLHEPIVGYGPFVMNSDAEIKQAFSDYQMGKLGMI